MKRNPLIYLLVIVLVGVAFWASRNDAPYRGEETFIVMSTAAETKLEGSDPAQLKRAADAVKAVYRDVESRFNIFNPASELARLNASAVREPFVCSDELYELIRASRDAFHITGGAFDISIRPLMTVWGFARRRDVWPPDSELLDAKVHVGLDHVIFNDTVCTVRFPDSGWMLDMGGIAKGYAVDRAVEQVLAQGVERGIINLGGNIRALPKPPANEQKYRVSVRHPLRAGENIGTLLLLDQSVATSGSYERFSQIGERRVSHIIDPLSGYPVSDSILAVTVVAPTAMEADILSTAIFVRGVDFAKAICEKTKGIGVLIFMRNPSDPKGFELFKIGTLPEYIDDVK